MAADNDIIVRAWNTVLFDKFVRFRHLVAAGVAAHSDEALRRDPPSSGERVLDVGCGFGDCTARFAKLVGPDGHAVGVDAAGAFIELARREAAEAGVPNVSFVVADVQDGDLGGPYARAFSRFGTMFFSDPVVALRNVQQALVPGGRLTMIVWRRREANPWLHDAELRVRQLVPVVDHADTDQAHCGPGPFSMANAAVVTDVLVNAGFDRVGLERHDADICIGRDIDEAVELAIALGPAGEIMRLAGDEGVRQRPTVERALRETLAVYATSHGVWAPSSTWFVSARRPP